MTTLSNTIARLRLSAIGLLARFGARPLPFQALRRVGMEYRELEEAVKLYTSYQGSALAVCEEAVDVMVTLFNLLHATGADETAIVVIMQRVIEKNDSKTLDTHQLVPIWQSVERRVDSTIVENEEGEGDEA